MIEQLIFPEGKKAAATFSYDDGCEGDVRLIGIFDRYGVKGTFHLNGSHLQGKSDDELREFGKRYEGHEIACHTFSHGFPTVMPVPSLVREVWKDREILEKVAGYPVVGMSYPFGDYNPKVEEVFRNCGILYSRTVHSGPSFRVPENFLEWHPSCHHSQADETVDRFFENLKSNWPFPLLYIWGHAFEFRTEEDWAKIEGVVKKLSERRAEIWFATNLEIYDYVQAVKALRISADETLFSNPSRLDVWVKRGYDEILKIPAGQTVKL